MNVQVRIKPVVVMRWVLMVLAAASVTIALLYGKPPNWWTVAMAFCVGGTFETELTRLRAERGES